MADQLCGDGKPQVVCALQYCSHYRGTHFPLGRCGRYIIICMYVCVHFVSMTVCLETSYTALWAHVPMYACMYYLKIALSLLKVSDFATFVFLVP